MVCFQMAFNSFVESLGVRLNPFARSTWVTPKRGAKPWFHSRLLQGHSTSVKLRDNRLIADQNSLE